MTNPDFTYIQKAKDPKEGMSLSEVEDFVAKTRALILSDMLTTKVVVKGRMGFTNQIKQLSATNPSEPENVTDETNKR